MLQPPQLTILGVYSPSMAETSYEQFIQAYAEGRDPANYDPDTIAMFRRFGREAELKPFTEAERHEIEDEVRVLLGEAVYIEVLARNVDASFDAGDFTQPDPSVSQQQWQAAWNETYLSEDGESVLAGFPSPSVPSCSTFRIVFTIHFWKFGMPLTSSYGELTCPQPQPLPERLWRLVPYELPN